MKKNLTLIIIVGVTIILAVLSVVTALKLKQLGTQPVAPSAPESKPKAQTGPTATPFIPDITPAVSACKATFSVIPSSSPTPGPSTTPSPGPSSTPPPGATSTPVPPTSTPVPPGEPYCDYLTADKTAGLIPLTVVFKGKGFDRTRVKGFRFTFGDGEKKEFFGTFNSNYVQEVSHTYTKVGVFTATLEIMDDGDHWRTRTECQVIITVGENQAMATSTPKPTSVAGATSTPKPTAIASEPSPTVIELPSAGIKVPTLIGIIAGFLLISLGAALVF